MFEAMAKSKFKNIIREKMTDKLLTMSHADIINMLNEFTDNEFKIDLINGNEQHTTELILQEYK